MPVGHWHPIVPNRLYNPIPWRHKKWSPINKRYREPCPCEIRKEWAEEERKDLEWIEDLPLCPCQVVPVTLDAKTWLWTPNNSWSQDLSCNPNNEERCDKYHPAALGCIRALSLNIWSFAGQQCCDRDDGSHIDNGKGAGTTD